MSNRASQEPDEQRDAPPERLEEEDAMRYPEHEDPDAEAERAGLDDE